MAKLSRAIPVPWGVWAVMSVFCLVIVQAACAPTQVAAIARRVQVQTAKANATSVAATFSPAAKVKHLLIAVCGSPANTTISTPAGFSVAKNEAGTPSQAIFYKVAAGGETTVTCTFSGAKQRVGVHIYEYSGTATTAPLDSVNAAASTGTSTTPSSGSVTTANAADLVFAAITTKNSSTFSAWTNTFTEQADFISNPGTHFGGADRYVSATGTYSTVATNATSAAWRGQIAAFKLLPIVLTGDIVNASNVSVANPSVAFTARAFDFNCQVSTATLGVAAEQIRVVNTTANTAWTLSLGATSGAGAAWSGGGSNTYDFNDPTSGGCGDGGDADSVGGQLTVDPSVAVITPDASCSSTGVSKGTSAGFNQGVIDSITLVTGSATAETNCMWNVTGITLSQQIPAEPAAASYSLGLTLTLVAN